MLDFKESFRILTGTKGPFPWQIVLFDEWFVKGKFPHSCNLPTGLGKTSVIAIWLIALLNQPEKIPRRLVYVVNRRTVVDQTTDEVEKLRENLRKLKNVPEHASQLPVSTLRGQFADNREWSADPSRPAVICGTVDMIGSRLLFSGYGVGFKAKPLHAGFLGQDVLLVHDEAHLEPAFQKLLTEIDTEQKRCNEFGKFHVMELSATLRGHEAEQQDERPFELSDAEKNPPEVIPDPATEPVHYVWRRQKAKKAMCLHTNEHEEEVADEIVALAQKHKDSDRAVLVFVWRVEDVEKIVKKLPEESTEQLTGTLRGLERDGLVNKPIFQRFLPESNRNKAVKPASGTVYLVCTSAGEVGVNISADHLVCDLSTFESMTQRFGRVNRFGERDDTQIDVVYPKELGKKDKKTNIVKVDELHRRRQKTLEILKQLNGDASPAALSKLDPTGCREAFAPPPAIPLATDILFDAWALTTIAPPLVRTALPGRPSIEPYLHGISGWQPPETHVAWRKEVEVITGALLERYNPEDLLEDYALKPHELLRDRSDRIFGHLKTIAAEWAEAPVWILDSRGQVDVVTMKGLANGKKNAIDHMTVLLPPCVGGLTRKGTLDGAALRAKAKENEAGKTQAEQIFEVGDNIRHDVADEWFEDKEGKARRRWRRWDDDEVPLGMRRVRTIDIKPDADEDEQFEGRRFWYWYARPRSADDDGSRSARIAQELLPHLQAVEHEAREIVARLGMLENSPTEAQAVILAAKWHDLGKKRDIWQRSIGNLNADVVLAKSGPGMKPRDITTYRHEFGSLIDVSALPEFQNLEEETKTLVLHLIAAHHGRARPHFPENEVFDLARDGQSAAVQACETPRRFARLQRKYGRWGLAYLESIVRAADYAVSAGLGESVGHLTKLERQS
jgi:CRISPR-associated endonuclease/helicase Cas3